MRTAGMGTVCVTQSDGLDASLCEKILQWVCRLPKHELADL